MTPEQERALALARARLRLQEQQAQAEPNFNPPGDVHEQQPPAGQDPGQIAARDFFPSLGTGIAQGAYELATLPATLLNGAGWLANQFGGLVSGQPASTDYGLMGPVFDLQQQGRDWLQETLHQPTTTTGEFARTIGEFAPGAVAFGPGTGVLGNVIRYGVVPGAISEAAGQMTQGTPAEPWARVAGGVLGTAGMGLLSNAGAGAGIPGSVGASAGVLGRALRGANITDAELAAANRLVTEGGSRGITLTWPEALNSATGGRVDLSSVQRVIEQSRGGQPIMSDVMASRPGAATRATAATTAGLGPGVTPTALGQLTQDLAKDAIRYVREQINAATRPMFSAAAGTTVDPIAFGRLYNDPLVQRAIRDIRASDVYGREVAGFGDDSVAMMQALKVYFEDLAGKEASAQANFASSVYGSQASAARDAGTTASADYADWLHNQSILRRDYLAPLEGGPLGTVAGTADIGAQTGALFPRNPFSGSAGEVRTAIRAMAGQNPDAAAALVRQHVEQVFNQATRNLTRGQNQFGAAGFVAELKGNPQQAANLEAAVRALPNGDARWSGLESLLRVLEATGARQPAGSPTTFNTALMGEMSRGTPIGNVLSTVASPTEAGGVIRRWYADFRLGRNSATLARIITDPASGPLLQRLAMGGSLQDMQAIAGALLAQEAGTVGGQNFGGSRTPPALIPEAPRPQIGPY